MCWQINPVTSEEDRVSIIAEMSEKRKTKNKQKWFRNKHFLERKQNYIVSNLYLRVQVTPRRHVIFRKSFLFSNYIASKFPNFWIRAWKPYKVTIHFLFFEEQKGLVFVHCNLWTSWCRNLIKWPFIFFAFASRLTNCSLFQKILKLIMFKKI